ncbi:MAG: class I SAM-dependent methyltransferase [Aequorivita sp.]
MKDDISKVLETNIKQREFYNESNPRSKNLPTRLWSSIRNGLLSDYRKSYDLKDRVYDAHREWMGDLSQKTILDLGCLRGNALSLYMAENAREYVGIDLSDIAISQLQKKILDHGFSNARAVAIDFLSTDFEDTNFDIIYAYGVLHHFEDFDMLINRINEKLTADGIIISYDPLETSVPIKIFRSIYRPFQSDKDWEWPFTKRTLNKIDSSFEILEKRGILGRSKYGIPLNFIPFGRKPIQNKINRMIEKDWNSDSWDDVYKCMHLTMKLKKRN